MSAQPMIRFIATNGLAVCSISTTVRRLESKDCVFAPYALPGYSPPWHTGWATGSRLGAGAALTLGYMRDKLRILDPFDPRMQDGKLRISVMCGIRRRYGIPRPARPGTGLTPGGAVSPGPGKATCPSRIPVVSLMASTTTPGSLSLHCMRSRNFEVATSGALRPVRPVKGTRIGTDGLI